MVHLLLCLRLPGYQVGDHWTIERTIHRGSQTQKDDLTYRVENVDAEKIVISQLVTKPGHSGLVTGKFNLTFRLDGVLIGKEPDQEPNLMRLLRVEWTALEPRHGLAWSRTWRTNPPILAGKVTVRPTARTDESMTLAVTYTEGITPIGKGTIIVTTNPTAIQSLSSTFGRSKDVKPLESWSINEQMKVVHLQDR